MTKTPDWMLVDIKMKVHPSQFPQEEGGRANKEAQWGNNEGSEFPWSLSGKEEVKQANLAKKRQCGHFPWALKAGG